VLNAECICHISLCGAKRAGRATLAAAPLGVSEKRAFTHCTGRPVTHTHTRTRTHTRTHTHTHPASAVHARWRDSYNLYSQTRTHTHTHLATHLVSTVSIALHGRASCLSASCVGAYSIVCCLMKNLEYRNSRSVILVDNTI